MKVEVAAVISRRYGKSEACEALVREYVRRAGRLELVESAGYATEEALVKAAGRRPGRAAAVLVVCDAAGELMTSEELAAWVGRQRDGGAQRMMFAVGPVDGWAASPGVGGAGSGEAGDPGALKVAAKVIAFGRMTLPHELARVVLAEQVYRVLTILAGHPYHGGH